MTAKLVLSLNGAVLREYPLTRERTTIGRRPENDIHVDNLAVSGQHALIITILSDSFLEDLGSTNGTYVNGKLVKKHALHHGDVITIGKHELKYVNEQASAQDTDFEKTMIIRPGVVSPAFSTVRMGGAAAALAERPSVAQSASAVAAAQVSVAVAAQPAPAPQPLPTPTEVHLPLAKVQVLNGPAVGRELELKKALTTLGKPGTQVAVITRRTHGYFITHVEGPQPLVNGDAIGAQAHPLMENDVIELAGVKMEFSFIS
jgi:pSer/pThr/pTyr-binding forkhead associated (FHA) protein